MAGLDPLGLVGIPLEGGARAERALSESSWSSVYRAVHGGKPCVLRAFPGIDAAVVAEHARDVEVLASNGAGTPGLVAQGVAATKRGEVPYVLTEWVDGPTLAGELDLRTAAYPLAEVAALVSALRRPFAVAHERGIVHGDVGPSSLHVDKREKSPVLRVVDFGVARALARASVASPYEPRHAAPEVADPTLGAVGPEADVFALALTMMEALLPRLKRKTGPLAHRKKKSLDAVDRPTPKKLGLDVPAKVAEVLERAVALRPEERFPDVVSFFDALAAVDAQFHVHVGRRGVEHSKPPVSSPAAPSSSPSSSSGGSGRVAQPATKVEPVVPAPVVAASGPEAFRTRGASDPPPPVRRSVPPPGRGIEAPLTFLKGPSEAPPPPPVVLTEPLAPPPALPRDLAPPPEVPSDPSPPVSSGTGKRRAPMGLASQSALLAASSAPGLAPPAAPPEVAFEPAAPSASSASTAAPFPSPVEGMSPPVMSPAPAVEGMSPPVMSPPPAVEGMSPPVMSPAPAVEVMSPPVMSPAPPVEGMSPPVMSPAPAVEEVTAAVMAPGSASAVMAAAVMAPGSASEVMAPAVEVMAAAVMAPGSPSEVTGPRGFGPVSPVEGTGGPVEAMGPPVERGVAPVDPPPARPPTASMLEPPPLPPMESSRGLVIGGAAVAVVALVAAIALFVGGRTKPVSAPAPTPEVAKVAPSSADPSPSVAPSVAPSPSVEPSASPSAQASAAPGAEAPRSDAFDASSAKAALDAVPGTQSECRKLNGPRGKWKATVTFEPSGAVSDVDLEKPFSRTPAGKCVRDHLKGATVPAFAGPAQKVTTLVTIAVSGK